MRKMNVLSNLSDVYVLVRNALVPCYQEFGVLHAFSDLKIISPGGIISFRHSSILYQISSLPRLKRHRHQLIKRLFKIFI